MREKRASSDIREMGLAGPQTRQISGSKVVVPKIYPNDGCSTQVRPKKKYRCAAPKYTSHAQHERAQHAQTTHLHDGGQPDGAVPQDRQALVGAPEIAAPADDGHAAVDGHFPRAYLVPEEGQDVGGRTYPSHTGIGQGPREGGRFGEEAVPCMRLFSFFRERERERERRDSRVGIGNWNIATNEMSFSLPFSRFW